MWTNQVKLVSDLKIFKIIFKKYIDKFLKIWYYIVEVKERRTKKMNNYENFKKSLLSKNLSPKEYEKAVKKWLKENEGRKRKKRK